MSNIKVVFIKKNSNNILQKKGGMVDSDYELHDSDVEKGKKLTTFSDVEISEKKIKGGSYKKNIISSERKSELSIKSNTEQTGSSPLSDLSDTITSVSSSLKNIFTEQTESSNLTDQTTEKNGTSDSIQSTEQSGTTDKTEITEQTEQSGTTNKSGISETTEQTTDKKKVKKGGNKKVELSEYSSVIDY